MERRTLFLLLFACTVMLFGAAHADLIMTPEPYILLLGAIVFAINFAINLALLYALYRIVLREKPKNKGKILKGALLITLFGVFADVAIIYVGMGFLLFLIAPAGFLLPLVFGWLLLSAVDFGVIFAYLKIPLKKALSIALILAFFTNPIALEYATSSTVLQMLLHSPAYAVITSGICLSNPEVCWGHPPSPDFGNPSKIAATLIKDAISTKASMLPSPVVMFERNTSLNARALSRATNGQVNEDEVCIGINSTTDFTDIEQWNIVNSASITYIGSDRRSAHLMAICDKARVIAEYGAGEYFEGYTADELSQTDFKNCYCLNNPNEVENCCLLLIKK